MGTFIVQFREDEAARDYLSALGLNPNDFGREAFERSLRELRAETNVAKVNQMRERIKSRLKGKSLFGKSGVEMLRQDRDSH
ncbi:MAG TPA: hypothetical protein VGB18_01180 [Candidatus Thermoplasmatota archaeon]